ncbi:hypothetical protein CLAUR_013300 [Clostridium felsineum]|nr:hypothetical protein CLAUR_013300 [Clostridium felsineum]
MCYNVYIRFLKFYYVKFFNGNYNGIKVSVFKTIETKFYIILDSKSNNRFTLKFL